MCISLLAPSSITLCVYVYSYTCLCVCGEGYVISKKSGIVFTDYRQVFCLEMSKLNHQRQDLSILDN